MLRRILGAPLLAAVLGCRFLADIGGRRTGIAVRSGRNDRRRLGIGAPRKTRAGSRLMVSDGVVRRWWLTDVARLGVRDHWTIGAGHRPVWLAGVVGKRRLASPRPGVSGRSAIDRRRVVWGSEPVRRLGESRVRFVGPGGGIGIPLRRLIPRGHGRRLPRVGIEWATLGGGGRRVGVAARDVGGRGPLAGVPCPVYGPTVGCPVGGPLLSPSSTRADAQNRDRNADEKPVSVAHEMVLPGDEEDRRRAAAAVRRVPEPVARGGIIATGLVLLQQRFDGREDLVRFGNPFA